MKIAIDTRELHGKPTGVGRFLRKLLDEWMNMPEAQKYDFISLAPTSSNGMRGTLWEQLTLPRLLRRAGADVLFAPAYSGPIFSSVPMVVVIHDVSFAAHPEWFGWREGARRRATVRLSARAASHVITVSEFSKQEIVTHLGTDASKISVVYEGVTTFVGPANNGRTRTEHASSRSTILFVGSIFNRRHLPELIEGFARLARAYPEVQLEVVGHNRTSPQVDVDAIARATDLGNRIHLRSYVSEEQLQRLYADASAFVFLSEYEGFGLTPLEALASGLPVVLLDTPVAREVCGDAAYYVSRPDPSLIETALGAVLFETRERERILNAAQTILRRYSWVDCARRILDVLVDTATRGTDRANPHRQRSTGDAG
jgi:glycosyltransferase involved in cell wall biosynthesis